MNKLAAPCSRWLVAISCAAFLLQSQPSWSQGPSDEDARKHFEAGVSYYNTSDYEGALREFQRAYQLSHPSRRPAILRSLASVYERQGELQKAIAVLKRALELAPEAPDRALLEERIANLEHRLRQQPAPVTSASSSAEQPPVPAPPQEQPSFWTKRESAYTLWGVGGAAAVGALVTGLMAQHKYNEADKEGGCSKTPQGCSDSEVQPIRNLALVSTVLTGVALVGVGLGTVLYVSSTPPGPPEQATGPVPRIQAGVTGKAAGIEARWVF